MTSRGQRILIVDDEEGMCNVLSDTLTHYGFHTMACDRPEEALDVLAREQFDLVLVDVAMPSMSGHAFLRAAGRLPSPPAFVLMSGGANAEDVIAGFHAGIQDFITKPFSPLELLTTINNVIQRSEYMAPRSPAIPASPQQFRPGTQVSSASESVNMAPVARLKAEFECGMVKLPSPEPVVAALTEAINRPDMDANDAARIVESIPQVAADVLRLANLPPNSSGSHVVTSLAEAAQRVGVQGIRNIARTVVAAEALIVLEGSLQSLSQKLWENGIATAMIARAIARFCPDIVAEQAYTVALFHNVGEMLVLRLLSERKESRAIPAEAVDVGEELGALHTDLGYTLCRSWGLEDLICHAAKRHHDPAVYSDHFPDSRLRLYSATAVLANLLAIQLNGSGLVEHSPFPNSDTCTAVLKLGPDHLAVICREGRIAVQTARKLLVSGASRQT